MEREYDYLLHLLGAYLWEKTPRKAEDTDWNKMMELADIHGVTGILSYMEFKYKLCADPQLLGQFRWICMSTISRFGQRGSLADLFYRTLSDNGIDHICMKGYVLRNYFPVMELRTFGDIDLVIRPEDRRKCHELMLSLGYQPKDDWEPVFSYYKGQEYYEIHTELLEIDVSDKADYRSYFRRMWDYTECTGAHHYEFKPEFHFLYMITHIAKHIHGSGAGIRMYLDVAAFIRHFGQSIDWNWIGAELEKLQLMDFAATVLSAVARWFDTPSPVSFREISPELLEEFTEYTLEAGVFGHHNREGAVTSLKNTAHEGKGSRFLFFLRRLFPSAKTIARRYTYLQKCPWLLPVAWIHRLIITRGSLGAHAHEAEVIFSAESDEIQRLKRITKNIGL